LAGWKPSGQPHPIRWLSDNGSVYAATRTIDLATAPGLVSCFTPVESPVSSADITPCDRPQTIGNAEAFAKIFKGD
jgi:hypothetical protein